MKVRTIAGLVGALALLALILVIAERSERSERRDRLGGGPLLVGLATDAVVALEIRTAERTWKMAKVDGKWTVGDRAHAADGAAIDAALDELAALDRRELASKNTARHADLEVDPGNAAAVEVLLWLDDATEPTHHLHLGKTAADFRSSFVRLDGADEVYLAGRVLRSMFDKGARGWRDRTVFAFDAAQAVRLEVTRDDATVIAEKRDDGWRLVAPEEGPANATTIESVLGSMSALATDEFASATDDATTGLDRPSGAAVVTLGDGTTHGISYGLEDDGKVYARAHDGDDVYRFFGYRKDAILKGLADLQAASDAALPEEPQTAPAD